MTLSTAAPKPAPRDKKVRKPLRAKHWGVGSKQRQPLPKVNAKAAAQRAIKQRKHYASPEYKSARTSARARAQGQCEAIHVLAGPLGRLLAILLPGELKKISTGLMAIRCSETEKLEFHEVEYGSDLGIIRPIAGFMVCRADHRYIEVTKHPTRHAGRTR